jgi:hypothetical protein
MPLVPFVPPGLPTEVEGDTPLHRLVSYGYHSDGAVEALLLEGENPDVRNAYGCTPLHSAVQLAYMAGIKLLLKHGADVDARNAHGECWCGGGGEGGGRWVVSAFPCLGNGFGVAGWHSGLRFPRVGYETVGLDD